MSTTRTTTRVERRTLLKLLGAGAVGVPALIACTPEASSGDDDDAGTAPDEELPQADTIEFSAWGLSEEASGPVIQKMLDDFSAANDVTITTNVWPFAEFQNQITLQARGGEASGAVQLSATWMPTFGSFANLVDLSAYAGEGVYTDAALANGQIDGRQVGLPWTIGSIGLVANSELLAEAGISDPPATIEDFEAMLLALQGVVNIPYAGMTKVDQLSGDIVTWMRTFGSPVVADGQITIGDEPSIEAVEWYKSLVDRDLIALDVDRFDARALFAQGETALFDDAIVVKGIVTVESPDEELGDKLLPITRPVLAAGDTPRASLWGHYISVFDGEGSGTAAELARYITSDPAATGSLFGDLGLPPATNAALESDEVRDDPFTTAWTERITTTADHQPLSFFTSSAQMDEILANHVQAVLIGDESAADAMAAAGEEMGELVD
jgi:multiple sugar transport system substrate-binding protein